MFALNKNVLCGSLPFFSLYFFLSSAAAWADPNLEEIQRRFNQETISKPFSVPDNATLASALKEATDRGTPTKSSAHVAPKCSASGWTRLLRRICPAILRWLLWRGTLQSLLWRLVVVKRAVAVSKTAFG